MQLQPIVDQVLAQLRAAAALGDERTRQVAEALAAAAEAAVRLAVLDAVTRAAGEITSTLFADGIPGSVTAQTRRRPEVRGVRPECGNRPPGKKDDNRGKHGEYEASGRP